MPTVIVTVIGTFYGFRARHVCFVKYWNGQLTNDGLEIINTEKQLQHQ